MFESVSLHVQANIHNKNEILINTYPVLTRYMPKPKIRKEKHLLDSKEDEDDEIPEVFSLL